MILTTTQIVARLGVSERTAQRGLNNGSIHARQVARARYEITEEEFERISTERDPHATELQRLQEELTVLSRHVSALEKELESMKISAPVQVVHPPRSVERSDVAGQSDGLPHDLVSWRPFADQHGMAQTTVNRAIQDGRLPVVQGAWKVGRTTLHSALDVAGRHVFYESVWLQIEQPHADHNQTLSRLKLPYYRSLNGIRGIKPH